MARARQLVMHFTNSVRAGHKWCIHKHGDRSYVVRITANGYGQLAIGKWGVFDKRRARYNVVLMTTDGSARSEELVWGSPCRHAVAHYKNIVTAVEWYGSRRQRGRQLGVMNY